jgi:Mg-chelatase subunit ChlD
MADWRGKSPKKDEPKQPTPMPVVSRPASLPQAQPEKTSADWRKSSKRSQSSSTLQSGNSRWSKRKDLSTTEGTGALKKLMRLSLVASGIIVSSLVFVWFILTRTPPIPILASVNSNQVLELGELAFPGNTNKRLAQLSDLCRRLTFTNGSGESDELLKAIIRSEDWIPELKRNVAIASHEDWFDNNKLGGGGPDRNVVTFYFQGFIARARDGRWQLLTKDADPFNAATDDKAILLEDLFKRISQSLSAESIAIVGLDVSPPNVITNLGDMSFPADEIERAFRSMGNEVDNIIVALPCQQDQENWIAPELSSSVFGHFFLEGIQTGFGDLSLTARTFQTKLKESVSTWVAQHRKANQQPMFLVTNAMDSKVNRKFYRFLSSTPPPHSPVGNAASIQERFQTLDRYWGDFQSLASYASWDPLLYGELESQLIALENVAETVGDTWAMRINQFESDLLRAKTRWQCNRRVSLTETEFNQRVRRCNVFRDEVLAKMMNPTLEPLASLLQQSPTGIWSNRDDRALGVWRCIETVARSDDASRWNETFTQSMLQKSFEFIGKASTGQHEWLEIQICKILFEEMDWNQTERNKSFDETAKAFAKLISCFSWIQQIANKSDESTLNLPYERLAWCRRELLELDNQFYAAFDSFCANKWSESLGLSESLLKSDGVISALHDKAKRIDLQIYTRDKVIREVPHLLALLMRLGRYSNGSDERHAIDDLATRLATVLNDAKEIERKLEAVSDVGLSHEEHKKLQRDFDQVRDSIEKLVRTLSDGADTDAESIRDYRIALRYPQLDQGKRKRFHRSLAEFYSTEKKSNSTDQGKVELNEEYSSKKIADRFLTELEKSNTIDRDVIAYVASSDLRSQFWPILRETSDPNNLTERESRLASYQNAARVKLYSNSFASKNRTHAATDHPWRTPFEFQAICEREFRELQSTRLYRARWGDGPYPENSEKLFFRQLAKGYIEPPRDCEKWKSTVLGEVLEREWDNAKSDLGSISSSGSQDESSRRLEVDLVPTNENLGWGKAMASIRQKTSSPKDRVPPAVASLRLKDRDRASIGFNYNEEELAYQLSIRGNIFDMRLSRASERARIAWQFTPSVDLASVKVTAKSETQFVAILLDCSASMRHNNSFTEAKNTVAKLLDDLELLSAQGISSEVSIIAFGLKLEEKSELPSNFVFATAEGSRLSSIIRRDGKATGSAVIRTEKPFVGTETDEFDQLDSLVKQEKIRADGSTPLYNAMQAGIELLKLRSNEGKKLKLIVISDGANDIDDDVQLQGGYACSFLDLKRSLSGSDIGLYVFQFDNEGFYTEFKDQLNYSDEKMSLLKQSNADLFSLVNAMSGTGSMQKPFGDFASLQKSLTESFSLPAIRLIYDGEKESIPLDYDNPKSGLKKGWCEISIGDRESNGNTDTAKGVPRTKLQITGNEKFELEYREQFGELRVLPNPLPTLEGPLDADPAVDPGKKDRLFVSHRRNNGVVIFEVLRHTNIPFRTKMGSQDLRFVPRPRFVVATVSSSPENSLRPKYILADHSFTASHPPKIFFPGIPVKINENKEVRFDIWYSDDLPDSFLETISLREGETVVARTGKASLKREDGQIVVKLPTVPDNRSFVLCPSARTAYREFYSATPEVIAEEVHKFDLAENPKAAEVFLIDEMSLQKAVTEQKIDHRFRKVQLAK